MDLIFFFNFSSYETATFDWLKYVNNFLEILPVLFVVAFKLDGPLNDVINCVIQRLKKCFLLQMTKCGVWKIDMLLHLLEVYYLYCDGQHNLLLKDPKIHFITKKIPKNFVLKCHPFPLECLSTAIQEEYIP